MMSHRLSQSTSLSPHFEIFFAVLSAAGQPLKSAFNDSDSSSGGQPFARPLRIGYVNFELVNRPTIRGLRAARYGETSNTKVCQVM